MEHIWEGAERGLSLTNRWFSWPGYIISKAESVSAPISRVSALPFEIYILNDSQKLRCLDIYTADFIWVELQTSNMARGGKGSSNSYSHSAATSNESNRKKERSHR